MESEDDFSQIEGEETYLGNFNNKMKMCNASSDTDINFSTIENGMMKSNTDDATTERRKHNACVGANMNYSNIDNGNHTVDTTNNEEASFVAVEADSREHTKCSIGMDMDINNDSIVMKGDIASTTKKNYDLISPDTTMHKNNDSISALQETNGHAGVVETKEFVSSDIASELGTGNDSISPDSKKEILSLKNMLAIRQNEVMNNLVSLDSQRLALQESSLLVQNSILQQRRVLLRIIEDIANDQIHRATKNSNKDECAIDKIAQILEKRNVNLQESIERLASLQENVGSESVEDMMSNARKINKEALPKLTLLTVSYMVFVKGEANFETLSSMIGELQSSVLNQDDPKIIASKILDGTNSGVLSRSRIRDVSVESSSTQISSGELSEFLTASTQTDFDGDKGCIGPSEGNITLTVNVDDIEENLDRCVESTPMDLLGLSWRIVVYKHWRDALQIRLYYKNLEFIEKSVEYVEYGYTFKLMNHISETWSICKKESHKIGRDAWWDNVIGWSRLEDPKNGYVNSKWFTIQAKVAVMDVRFY